MEYIYASLLLHGAKKEISEENLRRVLEAAGLQVDEIRLKATVAALKEINIDEILKSAAVVPAAAPVAPAPAGEVKAPAAEERKEEVEEEKEEKRELNEEELAAGLEALFG
uniref:Large ribosomal subunit protein P1 n=1 Tax=Fervidicoccus fontis TaxID=683846 RepID=A0A7J3ZK85_9CREN